MSKRYRSGSITIDLTEYLEEIEDDLIVEEFKRRDLHLKTEGIEAEANDIRDAHNELLCGRAAEALAILDRIVNPKWLSVQRCEADYAKAVKPEQLT